MNDTSRVSPHNWVPNNTVCRHSRREGSTPTDAKRVSHTREQPVRALSNMTNVLWITSA